MTADAQPMDWPILDDGRIRVKTTPWCHVDIRLMLTNVRICETPLHNEDVYERGWCFTGRSHDEALVRAVGAALAWDGSPDTEPEGWIKEVTSQRVRPDGDPARESRGAWPPPDLP